MSWKDGAVCWENAQNGKKQNTVKNNYGEYWTEPYMVHEQLKKSNQKIVLLFSNYEIWIKMTTARAVKVPTYLVLWLIWTVTQPDLTQVERPILTKADTHLL